MLSNLIEKQQKEIEDLQCLNDELQIRYKIEREKKVEGFVNKYKIREKIKELEDIIEGIIEEEKDVEDYQCAEYYQIQVLKELLGEP